ncbi:MAG: hypothetical protein WCA13_15720 [Terriglobales bacterium]
MKSTLVSLAVIMLLASGLLAQDEAKRHAVCEGEYSALFRDAKGDPKVVRVDHWRMNPMQDGSYSVDVELIPTAPTKAVRTEHHLLTKELKTKTFVSVMSNGVGSEIKIECDYGTTELSCCYIHDGSSAAATIRQEPPYVFWPSVEVPTLDLPWAFQAFVSQAVRTVGHKTAVPLVTLDEGQTRNSISLKVQEIEQVEYLGRETVEILGQKLLAHKFRLVDPETGAEQEFWVSESGLLLSMKMGEGRVISLTQYQGPSLAP